MPRSAQVAPYRTKGSAIQFRVGYYDRGLIAALEQIDMGINRKQFLANHIGSYLQEVTIPLLKEELKGKDPTTWNKTLPPTRRYKQSKSIYRRLADSLGVEIEENVVRAGSLPLPYGVRGSRQAAHDRRTIAQIVLRGMRPFVYKKVSRKGRFRKLPHTVRSSIKFGSMKRSAGEIPYSVYSSVPMQLKGKHPGFTGRQRMDFVGFMEKMVKTDYKDNFLPRALVRYARGYGFVAAPGFRETMGWKKFMSMSKLGQAPLSYAPGIVGQTNIAAMKSISTYEQLGY